MDSPIVPGRPRSPETGVREPVRRWRRQRHRRGVAVLTVLVLAALTCGVGYRLLPGDQVAATTPGRLTVATDLTGSYRLGAVRLTLHPDGLVQIRRHSRLLWTNQPGRAFVTGSAGTVTWTSHQGYFWPAVDLRHTWPDQRIDRIVRHRHRLVVVGTLTGEGHPVSYRAVLRPRQAGGVRLDVRTDSPAVDALGFATGRSDGAGVHGFGEQFDDFDLSGRLFALVDREQGVGRGEQPLTLLADLTEHGAGGTAAMTYAAETSFVTDDLRGVRLAPGSRAATAFAVADTRDPHRVDVEVRSRSLHLELTAAANPRRLIAEQQGQVSRPRLAGWTQRGVIVGVQGGTDRVRTIVQRLRSAGVRLAGVWIQDWTGQRTTGFGDRLWWTWQRDPDRYPNWHRLVHDLRGEGVHVTTYVNPFLVDATGRPGRNLWAHARDAGFLVRDPSGQPYQLDQGGFTASLVDLTNPRARRWFARAIAKYVLADGVQGFMADFGEGLPMDAQLHRGSARVLHDKWPLLWAKTVRRACQLAHQPDCVTWFRSGSPAMSHYTPMFWNGDQMVDYSRQDGLESALLGTFSAGVSGWPLVHADLGGYTSVDAKLKDYVRSPELLQRWGEYAAFGTMMRSHEGNRPDVNRQVYDPDEVDALARNSKIFAALAPYRRHVIDRARETGVPAVRHTWVNYPGTAAAESDRQFFLGRSVLVAPVLEEGADSVSVAFPPGKWVDLFTGTRYSGDRVATVPAPLGQPAAFVRADDPWLPRIQQRFASVGLTG